MINILCKSTGAQDHKTIAGDQTQISSIWLAEMAFTFFKTFNACQWLISYEIAVCFAKYDINLSICQIWHKSIRILHIKYYLIALSV